MARPLDAKSAERFANLALACVERQYPTKVSFVLNSDHDVKPPRELTPAFYGCYDWHSSVHGHWLLVRLLRLFPDAPFAACARAALAKNLTEDNLAQEAAYLNGPGRANFERPYGLAWLLQLAAELHEWPNPEGHQWAASLTPAEMVAVQRLTDLFQKLSHPVRSGEHGQSALSMGLAFDYARSRARPEFARLLESRISEFYLKDRDCPLNYEPSGEDFVSPCLAEADVVRRVLKPEEFGRWLDGFLPGIPRDGSTHWLRPAIVTDPTDGRIGHLDGLNLSRAWMLNGIAHGLLPKDPRVATLHATAAEHARDGLNSVTGEHYEGGHWLATFAVYLLTSRGF
jgi:hypothetical protein